MEQMPLPPERPGPAIDELTRQRLAEGGEILARLQVHRDAVLAAARAEREAGIADGPGFRACYDWHAGGQLAPLTAEQLRCLLFAVVSHLAEGDHQYSLAADYYWALTELDLDLTAGEVRMLAALAEPGPGDQGYEPFRLVVGLTARLTETGAMGATALAGAVADQVLDWTVMTRYGYSPELPRLRQRVAKTRDRALELAGRPPALDTEGVVSRDDGWGRAVIDLLGLAEDWPPGAAALLEHCITARSARPLPRWERTCERLLAAAEDATGLLRGLLDLVVVAEPVTYLTDSGQRSVLIGYNEQLIRGLVWAAGVLDPDWLSEMLGAVAARCLRLCSGHVYRPTLVPGERIPNACFRSLGRSGSDAAMTALARVGRCTANRRVLKEIAKTLAEVSARRGMSATSLLDRLTPDHGLSPDGQLIIAQPQGCWTIQLDDRDGAVLSGPPDANVPPDIAEALREIRATAAMTRDRLDGLFAERRDWHVEDFLDCYVRHPVGGWLGTRLAWTFTPPNGPGAPLCGFPDQAGELVRTVSGSQPVPAGSVVRLLHPVLASAAELASLRGLAAALGIIQPVRQLWRETYQISPAERQSGLYCSRFAGHILRFAQCYGVARRRGWGGGFLSGAWDSGDTAVARRDYAAAGLRASWGIREFAGPHAEIRVDLCCTEQLSFSPLRDVDAAPVPLADVPPEVLSEAMRDLGLVVSLTTVATDPAFLEGFGYHPGLDEYWQGVERGGLDQLRAHRREVLAPFYTGPAASDRVRLTSRELIVRGSLATYRIDLATASVRQEPAGRWLSFDTRLSPADARRPQDLGLPAVDDDEILHRIVIRAAILADDEQLASRKLLRQIRG